MTATYTIPAGEIKAFAKIFETAFADKTLRVTIESFPGLETPDETQARLLQALDDAKRGNFVHTMTTDEFETFAR